MSPSVFRRQPETARQRLGRRAERLALELLRSSGYFVERTNVRFPVGEIDVVAREGNTVCFIEVRSASSEAWGGAAASITTPKQRRIVRAAQWYLKRHSASALPYAVRFDVVAVQWHGAAAPQVQLLRGAFTADGLTGHAF